MCTRVLTGKWDRANRRANGGVTPLPADTVTIDSKGFIQSLLHIVYARVFLEFFIAIFRLAENNAELVALKRIEMGLDVPPAGRTGHRRRGQLT
jgi:hypothetical protein